MLVKYVFLHADFDKIFVIYMKRIPIILTLLTAIIVISCKETKKERTKVDDLFDEVMAVHDEVMPLMTYMHKNGKTLKSYVTAQSTLSDSLQQVVRTHVVNLENTSEAMMEWMANFSDPPRGNEQSAMTYLEDQKVKISKVSLGMKMAYEKSAVLIQQLKQSHPHEN